MQVSINHLADLTGRDRRTIKKRIETLPADDQGRYDSAKALPLIFALKDGLDPQQEKAKLDQARRELAELEFKRRRGELVSMETVFRVIESASTSCREHLLTIPGRLADLLAANGDARNIEATLASEIRTGLHRVTDVAQYDFGQEPIP